MSAFLFPILFIIVGTFLLIKGGGWTVDSAVFIARKKGIPPLIVGFTILAFGTSLPELIISVLANLEGSPEIALGNVIGSNIANILLVIGVSAAFVPLISSSKAIFRDLLIMIIASGILVFLLQYGHIGRITGGAMVLLLIGYVLLQYRLAKEKNEVPLEAEDVVTYARPIFAYGILLLGLAAVAGGADLLVRGAKDVALLLSVPEAVIGLSIVALGTSLPELSTCIIAAKRGQSDIVLGNVIGSNIFNILMILGVSALVKPIAMDSLAPQLVNFDNWVMLAVAVVFTLLIVFISKVNRVTGVVFSALYLLYNIFIYSLYLQGS